LKNKYKKLIIRELKYNNLTSNQYNDLLKKKELWLSLEGDYALTIQTDGFLNPHSVHQIQDFFKYDYVGGKLYYFKYNIFRMRKESTFNGGFSLRKISSCLKVISNYPPKKTNLDRSIESYPEDTYFYILMEKLKLNIGNDDFSKNFCFYNKYFKKRSPFCIHNIIKFLDSKQYDKFLNEYKDFKYYANPIFENKKNDIIITNHEIENHLNNFKETKIQKEKKKHIESIYILIQLFILIFFEYLYFKSVFMVFFVLIYITFKLIFRWLFILI
jgi:hypothetical protein